MTSAKIVVTGYHFTGERFRTVDAVIEEIIDAAQSTVHVLAYVISDAGVSLIDKLRKASSRGVKVILVLDDYPENPKWSSEIKQKIESLQQFDQIQVVNFASIEKQSKLHAKVVISDRERAVIGSANFSWGGMVQNHEVAVLIEGEEVWKLAKAIDRLVNAETGGQS